MNAKDVLEYEALYVKQCLSEGFFVIRDVRSHCHSGSGGDPRESVLAVAMTGHLPVSVRGGILFNQQGHSTDRMAIRPKLPN